MSKTSNRGAFAILSFITGAAIFQWNLNHWDSGANFFLWMIGLAMMIPVPMLIGISMIE